MKTEERLAREELETGAQPHRGYSFGLSTGTAGEPGVFTTANGQRGAMLRAYDKATGKEAGAVYMPTQQSGTPMTYMVNGKQYIVIAIGGNGYTAELRAFKLPD